MNAPVAPAFLHAEVQGHKHEVRLADVCRVGRSLGSDLMLDDESVSRNHALVYASEQGVYCVNDLGSSNGTFVNGSRVSSHTPLRDGDNIAFGSCLVRFRQEQAPAPVPVAAPLANTSVFISSRLITVLVVDIRGFTALAQRLDAATIAKISGAMFRQAGAVLLERGAWGQKYIGDAVMAVWLHSSSTSSDMANVLAALAGLARIAAGLQAQFGLEEPIRIGAGVNSGLASLGNVGSAGAPDYTALGDAVNRAFRLESATREVEWDVLMGAQTHELIGSLHQARRVFQSMQVRLKGYATAVPAWGARFEDLLPVLESMDLNTAEVRSPAKPLKEKWS